MTTTWTGEEWLAWGFGNWFEDEDGVVQRYNAAAYNPETKEWRDITPWGYHYDIILHPGTAWTGEEWIVWGGEQARPAQGGRVNISTGVRIDPATGEWQPMAPAPIEGRVLPDTFWTGKEVLFWQGVTEDFAMAEGGAAYDPSTDTWRLISTEGAPSLYIGPPIWAGSKLLFWLYPSEGETVAVQYDPDDDAWSPIPLEGAPRGTGGMVSTGEEMLAWGYGHSGYVAGGAYDPVRGSWRTLSTEGAPAAYPNRHTEYPVYGDGRMFVWGSYYNNCRVGGYYDVAADTWTTFTAQGAPSLRYGHHLAWTGHSLLVYGGLGGHEGRFSQSVGGEFFPDP